MTADEEPVLSDVRDRRAGDWTRLELLEMDQRFCAAVRQAHQDLGRFAGGTGAALVSVGRRLTEPERHRRVG